MICSIFKFFILALFLTVVNCAEEEISLRNVTELVEEIFAKVGVMDVVNGRTFGHNALKRLSFIFLPVMFTLGVISTLLMSIAIVSVKNLAIGVILLIVGISQAVARLISATTAQPILSYSALHSRSENFPQQLSLPWPLTAAATAQSVSPYTAYSPWARSDSIPATHEA